ncbi:MAG: TonB-dependent receptor [Pseudomonadota bacterium]
MRSRNVNNLGGVLALTTALMLTTASAAIAQSSEIVGLEEIIITAQKRPESIQEAPIAITAVSGDTLLKRSIDTIGDLAAFVPNLTATNGPQGSSDANFFVRGVGQFDFIVTNDPGVGVYYDGVYLGRTVGALLDTGDLERVEVLRGPQGTLFGRNTLGGAISVVSKGPQLDEVSGNGRFVYGSRDRVDLDAAINVPVGDTVAVRATGLYRQQDGQSVRQSDQARFANVDRLGGKVAVLFAPNEKLDVTLQADYLRDRGSANPVINRAFVPLPFFPADFGADTSDDFYTTFQSTPPENDLDIWGLSGTVSYDLDFMTVKSITAYRALEGVTHSDNDGTLFRLYDQVSDIDQSQFSQEFQFIGAAFEDRLEWLVGAYYFEESARQVQNLCFAPVTADVFMGVQPRSGPCVAWFQDNDQDTTSYALFGQANFKITDQLSFTAGGRQTWEDKDILTTQAFALEDGTIIVPFVTGLADSLDFSKFTPKVGLEYKPNEDLLFFASYSKGFRSGGFNGRLIAPNTRVPTYAPDTNDAFELGMKSDLLEDRLRVNATVFYSKYKGIQQTISDPDVQFRVANAGDAELYGFELELTAAPIQSLLATLAIGFTESEFTDVDPFAGIMEGNRLPFSPKWTVAGGLSYDIETKWGPVTPRVDVRYQSEVFFSPFNLPLESQGGYAIVDARIAYSDPGERYTIAFAAENLLDKEYFTFGQDALAAQGVAYSQIGLPREFSVSINVNF